MTTTPGQPRPLDHAVLPTADLSQARNRLNALGFTVAPQARHPFGTENACIYFADNTFLEPLAVGDRNEYAAAARAGNVFVTRDQAFRTRNGEDGFSALAFATEDADTDDAGFHAAGISAGPPLSFDRTFETPSGDKAEAGFRLAFAADRRAPDVFFFTCARVRAPAVDRAALEAHANGVTGITQVMLCAPEPSVFRDLLQGVVNSPAVETDGPGLSLDTHNAQVRVLAPAALDGHFGLRGDTATDGPRLRAVVFRVRDLAVLKNQLAQSHITFDSRQRRVIVAPAAGQGAIFAFEE